MAISYHTDIIKYNSEKNMPAPDFSFLLSYG